MLKQSAARYHRKGMEATQDSSWYLYILRCADGSLYTGITTDISRRLRQHNNGSAAKYTRCRRPVVLVYQETHPGKGTAQ